MTENESSHKKFITTDNSWLLMPDSNLKCPNCGTIYDELLFRLKKIPIDYCIVDDNKKQAYTYCFNCYTRNKLGTPKSI